MTESEDYIKDIIDKGETGSELLAEYCATTLANCPLVEVITHGKGGIAGLRIPLDKYVVVHSASGTPDAIIPKNHVSSLVEKLVKQAKEIGATPHAFANVIDARTGDCHNIETIAKTLVERANKHGLAILNGELAILGSRVIGDANLSGTMISTLPKGEIQPGTFSENSNMYAVFDPQGQLVIINSDGVGTKTEFYARAKQWANALQDSLAMKLDDAAKVAARARVVSDVVEVKGRIPLKKLYEEAARLEKLLDIQYTLQIEHAPTRIRGHTKESPAYNISGSVVSTIDEEVMNAIKPVEGNYLVAIAGPPNPRSNGITSRRNLMINKFGNNWDIKQGLKKYLDFLTAPSVILYPVFTKLLQKRIATSVYHMSGGAYKEKLAVPLAKHGLFVSINTLFKPCETECELIKLSDASTRQAYETWSMGNDGFVTTSKPDIAIDIIEKYGLCARVVGRLEKQGKTGVTLTAYNGKIVSFNGRHK